MKISQKNLTTDKIEDADALQDTYFSGYKKAVKSYLAMPEGDMFEAAKVLWQNIKDYQINVNAKYNDEAGKIENLLTDAENKYAAQIALLALIPFVTNLRVANTKLITLLNQHTDEDSVRVAGAMKAARIASDNAYNNLVLRVNALAIVDGEHDYEPFILKMNESIRKYRLESRVRNTADSSSETKTEGTE